ncbi:hypothetical protein [Acaryochloris thomasi]|uniref:hypothetical protein n=1 Tax=Acaryochloris thomasi TaxID=2929456 RepID=UPI000DA6B672|nr:hypothetical protein [Acaryochloris thomasi]
MNNQIDLSNLTAKQLTDLLWTLKGTPQAQPLYRELASRSTQSPIKPDDPNWEAKLTARLTGQPPKASGHS